MAMLIRQYFKRLFGPLLKEKDDWHPSSEFVHGEGDLRKREYQDYAEYVRHQVAKLGQRKEVIVEHDREFEQILLDRLPTYGLDYRSKNVLCLASRIGAEVRAFRKLGAFAVGIDLEPGKENKYVLYGDFHKLEFNNETVDIVYFNSIDHAYHVGRIVDEVHRVLKRGGKLILEIAEHPPGRFESIDTSSSSNIIRMFELKFEILKMGKRRNKTSFVDNKVAVFICVRD